MSAPLKLWPNAIVRTMREQGDKCYYCRRTFSDTVEPSLDHKIPTAHGGKSNVENLVLACKQCNGMKGHMPLGDFLAGFAQFNYKSEGEWHSVTRLVRWPRKWYHWNIIQW